jgi:RNA polymerase sigma-70 factor (ECF subfamily)
MRLPLAGVATGGDEPPVAASETAWSAFHARLRAFVGRRVANPADVDDIVQFAFLQLHRGLGGIRNGERIHAWLYSTARRAIVDYYRSRSRRVEVPSGGAVDLDAFAEAGTLPSDEEGREVARCLAPVLGRLGTADRQAILLSEVQGLRLAEAARRVGVSLSGMKSRVQRARRRLREAMLACCHVALDGRGAPLRCEKRADPHAGPDQGCATERTC